jgi:deoxyribonuclease V
MPCLFDGSDETITPAKALALQKELAKEVRVQPLPLPSDGMLIAGADCSYERRATNGFAAIVVCRWPSLEVVETATAMQPVSFPYIPGLLSFRELPLLHAAWNALSNRPDVVLVDGQGMAHPRRCGLASHAGLLWECPTVGCAKSLLVGNHGPLGTSRGSRADLEDRGEIIGAALRTRAGVSPVYISVGHLCDLESAITLVLLLGRKYRLPHVIRMAHLEVNRLRREHNAS